MHPRERTPDDTALRNRDDLPYIIELWRQHKQADVERVLGRTFDRSLGEAVFKAAAIEHRDRRVTLRCGHDILADSAG